MAECNNLHIAQVFISPADAVSKQASVLSVVDVVIREDRMAIEEVSVRPLKAGLRGGRCSEEVPRGTIEPERLQRVLRRLATGFYERDDVYGRIADRVVAEVS